MIYCSISRCLNWSWPMVMMFPFVYVSLCFSTPFYINSCNIVTFLTIYVWSNACTYTIVYKDRMMYFAPFCPNFLNFEMISSKCTSYSLGILHDSIFVLLGVSSFESMSLCDGEFSSNFEADEVSSISSCYMLDGVGGLYDLIFFLACGFWTWFMWYPSCTCKVPLCTMFLASLPSQHWCHLVLLQSAESHSHTLDLCTVIWRHCYFLLRTTNVDYLWPMVHGSSYMLLIWWSSCHSTSKMLDYFFLASCYLRCMPKKKTLEMGSTPS